jgi:hypothetical protein
MIMVYAAATIFSLRYANLLTFRIALLTVLEWRRNPHKHVQYSIPERSQISVRLPDDCSSWTVPYDNSVRCFNNFFTPVHQFTGFSY